MDMPEMRGWKEMIRSYPKIYNLGHAAIKELFLDDVIVEEKIDGSQISFSRTTEGELMCRSKGKDQSPGQQDKMFNKAIETIQSIQHLLTPGWTYRGEYLQKPKHNTIAYDRVPDRHIIIFDVDVGMESYMSYEMKRDESQRLGLECVPVLAEGMFTDYNTFMELLDTPSCLGGSTIEGVVIKNYSRWGRDKKALMGKYVSEKFKESNKSNWTPKTGKSIIQIIGESLRTEARWNKAIQHLRDSGELVNEPKDIGGLIRELQRDVKEECEDEIKAALFQWAWKDISRIVTFGFPEQYKRLLAESQFEREKL